CRHSRPAASRSRCAMREPRHLARRSHPPRSRPLSARWMRVGRRVWLVARGVCGGGSREARVGEALVTALFDTGVVIDHLSGRPEAAAVFAAHRYGAISVISWVELMSVAPHGLEEATRMFLHRFERLAINGAVAVHRAHPSLALSRALIYATALVNSLTFISVDVPADLRAESNIVVPYPQQL